MNRLTTLILTGVVSLSVLAGCGLAQRGEATWTGYSEVCIDNVAYIQFRNGGSVKYNVDGTIATC